MSSVTRPAQTPGTHIGPMLMFWIILKLTHLTCRTVTTCVCDVPQVELNHSKTKVLVFWQNNKPKKEIWKIANRLQGVKRTNISNSWVVLWQRMLLDMLHISPSLVTPSHPCWPGQWPPMEILPMASWDNWHFFLIWMFKKFMFSLNYVRS